MEVKIAKDKNTIRNLEYIRENAFGMKHKNKEELENNYFYKNIENGKMVLFYIIDNDQIVGGCIVSNTLNSLYIEKLFINPAYQNKGYGLNLLKYILEHKNILEEYYHTKFSVARLEPLNGLNKYYSKLGFKESSLDTMKKHI